MCSNLRVEVSVMDQKPWEVHPALKEDRLCSIANIISNVRHRTLALYDPNSGDGIWSLGCRIYERTINTLDREKENLPWLDTIRDGLYFVILVEDVPIRFYRGDVENPNARSLRRRPLELVAQQGTFSFYEPEWFWRLVVETDDDGTILRTVLLQYTETGSSQNLWEVPISEHSAPQPASPPAPSVTVVLDKPSVKLKQEETIGVSKNE